MNVHIEFWDLVTWLIGMLVSFASFCFVGGRILLGQFERRQTDRWSQQELARREAAAHWDSRFTALENASRSETSEIARIGRELLELKADLPVKFVRREDYVINQTRIEAKLDALWNRLDRNLGDRRES